MNQDLKIAKNGYVPITIAGREYHLRLTWGALEELAELAGVDDPKDVLERADNWGMRENKWVLYVALKAGGDWPDVSLDKLNDTLLMGETKQYAEAIARVVVAGGYGVSDPTKVKNPKKSKKGKVVPSQPFLTSGDSGEVSGDGVESGECV